jgi:hypothetical protein
MCFLLAGRIPFDNIKEDKICDDGVCAGEDGAQPQQASEARVKSLALKVYGRAGFRVRTILMDG